MDNAKVLELVNRIEAAARELAEITGEEHISVYVYKGSFGLEGGYDENGQKSLNFYRAEANNE